MSRTRTTVTMCVLVVMFIGGTVLGFQLLTAKAPSLASEADTPTCEPRTIESGAKLGSSQITVSLFNASTSSGLAHRTLNALEKKGFRAGEIGNAPDSVKHVGNVLIMTDDKTSAAVRLVEKQFKGHVQIRKQSAALDSGVHVVLGKHFKGVKKSSPESIRAKRATKVCVFVEPELKDQ